MATPSLDMANPQKNPSTVYDPQFLLGTIAVAGSASSTFDLQGWTQFALLVNPGNGTIAGTTLGTVLTLYAAQSLQDPFNKVYGTTGAVASTIQIGSTGQQVISSITIAQPLRFIQFVAPGTQSQAVGLSLLVK
jgi:hypothetical protein